MRSYGCIGNVGFVQHMNSKASLSLRKHDDHPDYEDEAEHADDPERDFTFALRPTASPPIQE